MTLNTYLITKLITSGTLKGMTITDKMKLPTSSPAPIKAGQIVEKNYFGPSYVVLDCCIDKS